MVSSTDISFHIISLGCAKNQVDSERVNGAMISAGYLPAPSAEDADIIIVNTCGFINDAKEESIGVIFDALEERDTARVTVEGAEQSPGYGGSGIIGRKVVVLGCLSQRYTAALEADIPEIDYIDGLADEGFVERMSRHFSIDTGGYRPLRMPLVPGLSYSYIKISEGCSNNCSYCAIPLIRGPHESYPIKYLREDAEREVARGARELVIVAQDIGAYCRDGIGLPGLVRELSAIDGVEWIRLMYCHPDHVDEGILGVLEGGGKVVPYIDIPFQHASQGVLRSMGRRGASASHLDLCARLRERVRGICIRSTFMVGYPSESDDDFEELLAFLRAARIDRVGAFIYSPEEGTPAWEMGDPVPESVKKERYHRLMTLQRKISASALDAMIGSVLRVMVEDRVDGHTWVGRSEYDAPEVDGVFYLTGDIPMVNSIVHARVTDAHEYDLVGEVV
ncbi:MAG: 30S ribosomal protein S12 methylthiotransferase RimO [Chrysiogenales bacterium]|nr:MAG: 30S ribosomal protein S12 methylthiotransferase RimO [Chrysiogenales bacterium]